VTGPAWDGRAWNSTLRPGKPPQRRKGLTGAGLSRTARLRPVSARRAAENRDRAAMAAALFPGALGGQERPLCGVWQARLTIGLPPLPGCTRWGDDLHEPLSRARGGGIADPGNATVPCRPCHDVLTFTPESELGWAYCLDLLRHSWASAGEVPDVA